MLPSGVAWLGEDEWSLTLSMSDINYVSATQDHQESIVDRWARFLNSAGAGTRLQETVINRVLDDVDVASLVQKPFTGDPFDALRADFNKTVRDKLAAASGNTVTEKYITVTVQETDKDKAEATLTRIEHEIQASLSGMDGCRAERLTRAQRLAVLSNMVRPGELFSFNENEFTEHQRRATHDYIAPWRIDRGGQDGPITFINGAGDTFHTVLWVRDYPVWMSDRLITELTEIKCDLTVSLHLEPYDQVEGMAYVERQIAELEMQTINERKKAQKQGLGEDMIPQKLVDNLEEARDLRRELSTSNQKVFSTVMVIGVSASSKEQLEQNVKRAMTVIRKQSVSAEILRHMQIDGLTTELPIGRRCIPMRRTLTTSSAAILVPFTTQELFVPGGHWYGVNTTSSNAIVADRTQTMNGNGFILGTSGSGKSQFAKGEITNTFLSRPHDDIIIIDPEREYEPLVRALHGTVVRIHAGSEHSVNPMDIELDVRTTDEDPVLAKSTFVLTMLKSLVGGSEDLSPRQISIADRVTVALYRKYAAERGSMPTLSDLRAGLVATQDPEALSLATGLEIYTTGSLGGFSNRTNVDQNNRLVAWDISQLSAEMKTYGMMVILDQIWNRVARNRAEGRRTWVYIDEFHLMFLNRFVAEWFRQFYARARKWGAIPTGITQNIEAVLANGDARLMLANSNFLAILGQTATDAGSLTDLLAFSDEQRRSFENVLPGQGLIKSGSTVLGFDSRIPDDSLLYNLYQTSFEDLDQTGRA